MLQCIFLSRSFADPALRENDSTALVIISLVASVFSISSRYAELDSTAVTEDAQESEWAVKKIPTGKCINFMYVVRILWRFNFLVARMFLLVCIWLVLGGEAFAIFMCVTTLIWIICLCRLAGDHCCEGSCYYIWCIACIANPITSNMQVQIMPIFLENPKYKIYPWSIFRLIAIIFMK